MDDSNPNICENPALPVAAMEISSDRVRSKREEYMQIADLTGFDNLRAMLEAEALVRARKALPVAAMENISDRVKSKQEEYKLIADLTGFDNLKTMLEAEALIRARKGARKKKMRKKKKKGKPIQFAVTAESAINKADTIEDRGKNSDGTVVEALKTDLVQKTGTNVPQELLAMEKVQRSEEGAVDIISLNMNGEDRLHEAAIGRKESIQISEDMLRVEFVQKPKLGVSQELIVDATKKKLDTTREMEKESQANDVINSTVAMNLSLSSLDASRVAVEMVPREDFKMVGMIGNGEQNGRVNGVREENQADTGVEMEIESNEIKDNFVLRNLLRKPRYFDPSYIHCLHCGQEGHETRQCTMQKQKQKKPCYICGSMHIAKYCKQRYRIRERKRHLANEESKSNPDICLRCGNSGHDMFSCRSDYSPDDLKKVRCYVCRRFGHLCCVDFPDMGPVEHSCYNCGQPGHYLGSECIIKNFHKGLVERPRVPPVRNPHFDDTDVRRKAICRSALRML